MRAGIGSSNLIISGKIALCLHFPNSFDQGLCPGTALPWWGRGYEWVPRMSSECQGTGESVAGPAWCAARLGCCFRNQASEDINNTLAFLVPRILRTFKWCLSWFPGRFYSKTGSSEVGASVKVAPAGRRQWKRAGKFLSGATVPRDRVRACFGGGPPRVTAML